jgi:hypothetical protein
LTHNSKKPGIDKAEYDDAELVDKEPSRVEVGDIPAPEPEQIFCWVEVLDIAVHGI